ncbi:hypothetical protein J3L18_30930 [Mucilaginibacter gossypii]|uniref:hypothetical protein n=1 Tax=Mucilaginibacter gossypii TaxID=551996 RepID=UPI000DCB99D3|nr:MULTISPECIES: hypothetical protein [Mucilaginibacter]QTE37462.1 hypothetical protein J3L18_30930 [Mucilaginibacter gossypii]RAV47477.1 hypothetical protein DIU36_29455 [Mucilaginibacter rubeus]
MSLKSILESIFPFLFNAVERFFDKLPKDQQQSLIQAGQFGQIIKKFLTEGYQAIIDEAGKIGIDSMTADKLLNDLGGKLGLTVKDGADLIDQLQAKVNAGLQDSAWDNLWTSVSGQLSIIIAGGAINWPTLALGLVEFVYQKFIKANT